MLFLLDEKKTDTLGLDKSGLDDMPVAKNGENDEGKTSTDSETSTKSTDASNSDDDGDSSMDGTDSTSSDNSSDPTDGDDSASDDNGSGSDATPPSGEPSEEETKLTSLENRQTVVYNNIVSLSKLSDQLMDESDTLYRSLTLEKRKSIDDVIQSIEQTNSRIKRLLVQFPRLDMDFSVKFYTELREIIKSDAETIKQLIDDKAND